MSIICYGCGAWMYEADRTIEILRAEKDELARIALLKEQEYLTQRNRNIELEQVCFELESELRLLKKQMQPKTLKTP